MSTNLTALNGNEYVIVDLDTGAIVGTNIVLVKYSDLTDEQLDLMDEGCSDSEVVAIASEHGVTLTVQEG